MVAAGNGPRSRRSTRAGETLRNLSRGGSANAASTASPVALPVASGSHEGSGSSVRIMLPSTPEMSACAPKPSRQPMALPASPRPRTSRAYTRTTVA